MAKVIRTSGPGKEKLVALLAAMQDAHVRVGWLETATYENGIPAAYVAAIHENGVPEKNIPARPMLRPTVDENEAAWGQAARALAAKVGKGELTLRQFMGRMGALAAGNLKTTIGEITSPPLADETIMRRAYKKAKGNPVGSLTKPLQETDYLHSSVDFEVTDGKPQGGES